MKQDDWRKLTYEKAIDAYQFHINRFHSWINYYALFDGALFVAYYTLLCATNIVLTANGQFETKNLKVDTGVLFLENNYKFYLIIISLLGLIVSILWLLSILGHNAWANSWMKIIEKYEEEYRLDPLYSLIILDSKYNTKDHTLKEPMEKKSIPNGFSTSKVTIIFILVIILAWFCTIITQILQEDLLSITTIILLIAATTIAFIFAKLINHSCRNIAKIWIQLYSDTSSKKIEYR